MDRKIILFVVVLAGFFLLLAGFLVMRRNELEDGKGSRPVDPKYDLEIPADTTF